MTVQQATSALTARGLRYGDADRHERPRDRGDGDQAGTRRGQRPRRGGSSVDRHRSRAARSRCGCPDLAARTCPTAKANLEAVGLRVGNIEPHVVDERAGSTRSSAPTHRRPRSSPRARRSASSSRAALPRCRCPTLSARRRQTRAGRSRRAASCPQAVDDRRDGPGTGRRGAARPRRSAGTMARAGS